MLSILIPVYNYNTFPLVAELQKQCLAANIDFEILCQDDFSTAFLAENQYINNLESCRYTINKENIGRASNINKLVSLSKFDYVLITEADSFPSKSTYIQSYVKGIKRQPKAVFGGVLYSEVKPSKKALLRWIYGTARESKDLSYRLKNPSDIVFTWNLLMSKEIFFTNPFDSSIRNYGFEDLVFLKQLKKNNISIEQIDNPCIHQNEEQSAIFLEKSKIAVLNLTELYHKKVLYASDSSLLTAFETIKKVHSIAIIVLLFNIFEKKIRKNLLSKNPVLFLFDVYRLGYFCKQTPKK